MIYGLDKIEDIPTREMCAKTLQVFLENRACRNRWEKPFLEITRVFGAGKTGSAVTAVRYGDNFEGLAINHIFRVLKIGESASLLEEKNGFSVFNKQRSEYFIFLTHDDADVCNSKKNGKSSTVLEYDDARINSSAQSLKSVSDYVIHYYYESMSRGAYVDPNPLGENIGDVLCRMFRDLKAKVYGAENRSSDEVISVINRNGSPESKTFIAIFTDKIEHAFSADLYHKLDALACTGKTHDELLGWLGTPGSFLVANHIHGDMNPGNVLLCVDDNGRDITAARLIDYGEVIKKKREGLTFVFWDPARLIGEFVIDFAQEIISNGREENPESALLNVERILSTIFTRDNRMSELSGIWLFHLHVLAGMIYALFAPAGADNCSHAMYQNDAALDEFLRFLTAFLLFNCKFENEKEEKRQLALKIAAMLQALRIQTAFATLMQSIESIRGEVITRSDTRRVHDQLKDTRFTHLRDISRMILSGFAPPKEVDRVGKLLPIDVSDEEGVRSPLYGIIMRMKEEKHRKLLITGGGGMGKTTALFNLFEELSLISGPIPLYLELQWINTVDEGDDELIDNWILNHLVANYTSGRVAWDTALTPVDKRDKLRAMFNREELAPRFVLLLDGFNEVTRNRDKAVRAIQKFEEFKNVIVIVASRPMSKEQRGIFIDYYELVLTGIGEKDIRAYLGDKKVLYPQHPETARLLNYPFFLCLYAGTEAEKQIPGSEEFIKDFIENPETPGDMLHNFFCATRLKWYRTYRKNMDKTAWQEEELRYYLELVLPEIAFYMERAGIFQLGKQKALELIAAAIAPLEDEAFLRQNGYTYPLSKIRKELNKELETLDAWSTGYVLDEGLSKQLSIVNDSGGRFYAFVHQNFRDYFAACYIQKKIKDFLEEVKAESPAKEKANGIEKHLPMMRIGVLSLNVRRMLGELFREHKNNLRYKENWFDDSHYYNRWPESMTGLDKLLDSLRRVKDDDAIGYLIYNVIQIFKESGKDLSMYDFSHLHLKRISFNGVKLGRGLYNNGESKGGAKFDSCELRGEQYIPKRHLDDVVSVLYSLDGQSILSFAKDGLIKKWDVKTGNCIKTFYGHTGIVSTVDYSPNGNHFLSGSHDGTIKEWDVHSGKILRDICISLDEFDVEDENDKFVLQCDLELPSFLRSDNETNFSTYKKSISKKVISVKYSQCGNYIIAGIQGGKIILWDLETSTCKEKTKVNIGDPCIKITPNGILYYSDMVIYSPDFRNALALISDDNHEYKIDEIELNSKNILNSYCNRNNNLNVLYNNDLYKYSPDGRYIVVAFEWGTIKQWDRISGDCTWTINSNYFKFIKSINYSPDCLKLIINTKNLSTSFILEICVMDGQVINKIVTRNSNDVTVLKYSPDDTKILTGDREGTIKVWDRITGKCIMVYGGSELFVKYVRYTSDCKCIVSSSLDNIEKIWDEKTGEMIKTNKVQIGKHRINLYSTDGNREIIITEESDSIIKEIDVTTRKCILNIPNISGLLIQGIDLTNATLNIPDDELLMLYIYGACLSWNDEAKAKSLFDKWQSNNGRGKHYSKIDEVGFYENYL